MENGVNRITLERKVNEARKFYLSSYGKLDWHWYDEGLVYAVQDYHSSMGEFTEKDRLFARENGFADILKFVEIDDN